jgi:hypothetical protein
MGRRGGRLICYSELENVECSGTEVDGLAGEVGEVDEEVGAFGGGQGEEFLLCRCGEEALVAADLNHWLMIVESQAEEAAIGGVKDAKAVESRLNFEIRANFTVDEDAVGSEFGDPRVIGVSGGGVEELAVGGEVAVVEDEGDLIFAGGEVERVFGGVADEEEAEETGVGVEAVETHGVVVIPEGGGILLEGVEAGFAFAGDEPVGGVAISLGGYAGTVDVGAGADFGNVAAAAVEAVIDG